MTEQKIYVIGDEEIVLMLGLLGIQGTIVKDKNDFLKEFNKLIKDTSIYMIIIALDLSDDIIDYLIDYKLNIRKPFLFHLPDIFQLDSENKKDFLTKIIESVGKILS